ncbi:Abi family protein [Campylobacter lari]|nr:Abi family protein [Campylobacter lari]MCV3501700.1 Abi family protein [Campylobacter lari]
MKKPFYKLKRFYIPCIILIIILAVLAKLLYSPLYTIYWGMYHFPKKEQEFRIFEKMTLNPSPKDMIKIVDDYQPKLEDFRDLNTKMQKAIFDFKVAKLFGFEDRYFEVSLKSYISLFIFLHGKEHTYFNYLNFISDLNSNEKQKYLNLRASTKDLEKQIFEEKLKFIKHYEEFYDYLDSIGYLDKGSWYKAMALYSKVSIQGMFLLYNTQLCSFKDKLTIFKQVKESYNTLKKLDTLEFSNEEINKKWKSNHKAIIIFIGNYLNKIQKALDECK